MADLGCTHVAIAVSDTEASAAFYETYADFHIVHRRAAEPGPGEVVWLSDGIRPFVVVLLPHATATATLRGPLNHLGVGLASKDEIDRRLRQAASEGKAVLGPSDDGPPVGYWGIIEDPDGNALELSFGQEVGLTASAG